MMTLPNETIFQSFHWYSPADGSFWNNLGAKASELKDLGVTMVWLPPAYKTSDGAEGVGYAVYDLYDLGEFDQQGTVRTKYGTKDEYIGCIEALRKAGIKIIVDVVLNHRLGGDEKEVVTVQGFNEENRAEKAGEPFEIEVVSKFTFPGRKGKYSKFVWDFQCFTGISGPPNEEGKCVPYRILNEYGDNWDEVPSKELGNFDYLLGADVELRNPAVQQELKDWASWYYDLTKFDGVRLDAIKHMNTVYTNDWVAHVKQLGKNILAVGEYWSDDLDLLKWYIDLTKGEMQLFDAPLHYRFVAASENDSSYDMRQLFDKTLVSEVPLLAVTLVDNHDTQPCQTMESTVDYWFQALAYALILLREQGLPCIFYPSVYGAKYSDNNAEGEKCAIELNEVPGLRKIMKVRKDSAYGTQRDYFDHQNVVGWTREGIDEVNNSGCAVLLSNGAEGGKYMEVGKRHAGKKFVDALGYRSEEVEINSDGWGEFFVHERSLSVWIPKN